MSETAVDPALTIAAAAQAAWFTAARQRIAQQSLGATLATARHQVYSKAAEYAREFDRETAIERMTAEVAQLSDLDVKYPPRFMAYNWDDLALRYLRCRAWQWCLWQLDPTLPEVAPNWEGM